jgi:hypothetical protein
VVTEVLDYYAGEVMRLSLNWGASFTGGMVKRGETSGGLGLQNSLSQTKGKSGDFQDANRRELTMPAFCHTKPKRKQGHGRRTGNGGKEAERMD